MDDGKDESSKRRLVFVGHIHRKNVGATFDLDVECFRLGRIVSSHYLSFIDPGREDVISSDDKTSLAITTRVEEALEIHVLIIEHALALYMPDPLRPISNGVGLVVTLNHDVGW